jgi:hypothetical protein
MVCHRMVATMLQCEVDECTRFSRFTSGSCGSATMAHLDEVKVAVARRFSRWAKFKRVPFMCVWVGHSAGSGPSYGPLHQHVNKKSHQGIPRYRLDILQPHNMIPSLRRSKISPVPNPRRREDNTQPCPAPHYHYSSPTFYSPMFDE